MHYFIDNDKNEKIIYEPINSTMQELIDPNSVVTDNNNSLQILNNSEKIFQLMNHNLVNSGEQHNKFSSFIKFKINEKEDDAPVSANSNISKTNRSHLSIISKNSKISSINTYSNRKLDHFSVNKKSDKRIIIRDPIKENLFDKDNDIKPHLKNKTYRNNFDKEPRLYLINNTFEEKVNKDLINSHLETRKKIKKASYKNVESKKKSIVKDDSSFNMNLISQMLIKSNFPSQYENLKYNKMLIDMAISIILTINIIFTLIDNEIDLNYTDTFLKENLKIESNEYIYTLDDLNLIPNRNISVIENCLRSCNVIFSVVSCCLIIFGYHKQIGIMKIEGTLSKYDNIWNSGLFYKMIFEILISVIFYPPKLNCIVSGGVLVYIYACSWNTIFSFFVMTKIYIILGVLKYFTYFYNDATRTICTNYKVDSGFKFALKSEIKKRPAIVLTFLFILSLFLLSFSMRNFEYRVIDPNRTNEMGNDLKKLSNCFWLIIMTVTSVGYGDFYPKSHFGRLVGVIASITGMFLFSLLIVSFNFISDFTHEEKKAFTKLKKLFACDNLESKAADVIKSVILIKQLFHENNNISKENYVMQKFVFITRLKKGISVFKNDFKIADSFPVPVDEMLSRLQNKLKTDVEKLSNNLEQINEIDLDLDNLNREQEKIQENISEIIEMQKDISKYLIDLNNTNRLNNSKNIYFNEKMKSNSEENKKTYNKEYTLGMRKQSKSIINLMEYKIEVNEVDVSNKNHLKYENISERLASNKNLNNLTVEKNYFKTSTASFKISDSHILPRPRNSSKFKKDSNM